MPRRLKPLRPAAMSLDMVTLLWIWRAGGHSATRRPEAAPATSVKAKGGRQAVHSFGFP